jgi:hypothetical protein
MEYKHQRGRFVRHMLSFPFIWIVIIPFVFMDIIIEIYHRICFWLYGIPYVKRSEFIKMDRHKLSYLKWYDKINCAYCGYANGLLRYDSEIAARTEKYWCSIKHQPSKDFVEPSYQRQFLKYGDEKAYRKECDRRRKK